MVIQFASISPSSHDKLRFSSGKRHFAFSTPRSRTFSGKEVALMQRHKIETDLIFYIPGHHGAVFTYKAGHSVSDTDIKDMREHLKFDTSHNIGWIEDRRLCDRHFEWSDILNENNLDLGFI
jgi:hypothetical protein